jgi:hypothetical protein
VDLHRLDDDLADGEARIQRRVRVLEDDLDAAAIGHHLALGEAQQVLALEQHLAAGGVVQAHEREAHGGLARARLAHEPRSCPWAA